MKTSKKKAHDNKLRLLAIGAHPDDCEILAGGLAAKYSALGHAVKFVSATNGDTGHFTEGGGQLARRRAEEAMQAAAVIGIEAMVLDIHNNGIEADIPTREIFIKLIREYKPDIIITHRPWDYHPDHRRTALLVQDSSYAVLIPNVCPLTPCLTKSPVIMYTQDNFKKPIEFNPEIVISIDDVIEQKVKMLDCHKSQQYEWLPWVNGEIKSVPSDEGKRMEWLSKKQREKDEQTAKRFRIQLRKRYGLNKGEDVKYAEAFELCEYGASLDDEMAKLYFPF